MPGPGMSSFPSHPQDKHPCIPDRSPVLQRPNPGASPNVGMSVSSPHTSTALIIHPTVAHSPRTLISPSGTLILDKRTADEQKARLAAQASSNGPSTKPPRERDQQDMELIRHAARDRDRDRDRDRPPAYPQPPTIGPGVGPQPGHDPHERERAQVQHVHRMSPLTRTGGPPPKGPMAAQQSPSGSGQRMGIPFHDRDRERERERMPPFPHDRDRDRPLHGPPSGPSHSHPPPHHPQHRGGLLGQGQFHAHPMAEWDRNERENEYAYHPEVTRERERERDRQRLREREREREIIPGPSSAQSQRDRDMMDGPGIAQRERELSLRDREHMAFRERDRRTLSRVPSPHPHPHAPQHPSPHGLPHPAHAHGHPGIPLGPGGVSGPGMPPPGPHGMPMGIGPGVAPYPPHQHDLARDRDRERERERDFPIGLTERDQLVRERECEREREYRERIALADRERERMEREKVGRVERDRLERDRMDRERDRVDRERGAAGSMANLGMGGGMPHAERPPRERVDREREHRDRAIMDRERDRALYEREREHHRITLEREQHPRELLQRDLHREREREHAMAERDRGPNRMIDIPMSALDREREGERGRGRVQQPPYDRGHPLMEPHRHEVMDRERMDASEREREREKGRDRMEMMERDHERDRDREQRESGGREKEAASVPMAADSKNDGSDIIQFQDPTLATTGVTEHENKQPEAMDVDSTDRERLNLPERERERLELRDRLELLEREQFELIERERLGTLDMADRERLEMIERERIEILGREHLETLERPSATELAKARQEREKRPFVNLGVYVWPRTPFPYYFPEYIPTPVIEEGVKSEEGSGKAAESSTSSLANSSIPTELRLTVIIPPAFLPPCRPSKFRLWGGGHPPPTPFLPPTTTISPMSRRRVYTDDSNVIESAVHAGLLTWSGIARAKQEQRAVRAVLALVPTLSSASGAVRGPAGNSSAAGINGTNLIVNGHVNGTTSVPRTRTSTPMPSHAPPSTSAVSNEPGYAGGIWASRFIGGWGEAFYGDPSAGRGEQTEQVSSANEAEDDGRGCVSCGWGWGHDGSAFEVISVDVVEVRLGYSFSCGGR